MEPDTNKIKIDAPQHQRGVWPGAFGAFSLSKAAVMVNVLTLIGLIALSLLAAIGLSALAGSDDTTPQYWIFQLLSLLFSSILSAAMTITLLRGVRGEKISPDESLKSALPIIVPYTILGILTGIIAFISFIALIIPFFFVLPRLLLAEFYLVDKKLGPIEALKAGWNNGANHFGKVWGIIGATLLMIIPAFTIIGIPITFYLIFMYLAAVPVLYYWIEDNATSKSTQPEMNGPIFSQK